MESTPRQHQGLAALLAADQPPHPDELIADNFDGEDRAYVLRLQRLRSVRPDVVPARIGKVYR